MRKPYLTPLRHDGELRCFKVDGEWIRNHLDVDFTNGAHHLVRAYVPADEIWVDREAPGAGELEFLIEHQARQHELMERGIPYLRALRIANHHERRARRRALGIVPERRHAKQQVKQRRLGELGRDTLWLVDGARVRAIFDPNFTQGGHGYRYRFIPRREIWIDDAVVRSERTFVVEHEVCELGLMREGMGYDDAHDLALALERRLRRASLKRRRTG